MARYKFIEKKQILFVQVELDEQLIPGTIEYGLHRIIDGLDLSVFDVHFKNNEWGAKPILLEFY